MLKQFHYTYQGYFTCLRSVIPLVIVAAAINELAPCPLVAILTKNRHNQFDWMYQKAF